MRTTQIHCGKFYEAFHIVGSHGGIVVSSKRKRGGVKLPSDHPQFKQYLDSFMDGDSIENEGLCRALLGS